ncbi:MAG: CHAT domain-containing protein [Pseudonocardiaceae bacterium]
MLSDAILKCWWELIADRAEGEDENPDVASRLATLTLEQFTSELSNQSERGRLTLLRHLTRSVWETTQRQKFSPNDQLREVADWYEVLSNYPDESGWSRRLSADAELLRGVVAERLWDSAEAVRSFRLAAFGFRIAGEKPSVALAEAAAAAAEMVSGGTMVEAARAAAIERQLGQGSAAADFRCALEARVAAVRQLDEVGGDPGNLARRASTLSDEIRVELMRGAESSVGRFAVEGDVAAATSWAHTADELRTGLGEPPRSLRMLANYLMNSRKPREAVPILEELVHRSPDDNTVTPMLADAYAGADRIEDAITLMSGRLGDPPTAADAEAVLFMVMLLGREHHPAAAEWEAILAQIAPDRSVRSIAPSPPPSPERAPLRAALVGSEVRVGEDLFELPLDEQRAHLAAAVVAGSPNGREMLQDLVTKDPELGTAVARLLGVRLVSVTRLAADEAVARGEEHFQAQRFTEAAGAYREALAIEPDHPAALLWLGDVHYRLGAYDLAWAFFEEVLEVEENPQAWRFLGDSIRGAGGGVERVRECYRQALALDPGYGGAKSALASLSTEPSPMTAVGQRLRGGVMARRFAATAAGEATPPIQADPAAESAVVPDVTAESSMGAAIPSSAVPVTPAPAGSVRCGGAANSRQQVIELEEAIKSRGDLGSEIFHAVAGNDEPFVRWLDEQAATDWSGALALLTTLTFHWGAKAGELAHAETLATRAVLIAERIHVQWPENDPGGLGRARHRAHAHQQVAWVLAELGRYDEERAQLEEAEHWMAADAEERARAGLPLETDFDMLFESRDPRAVLYHSLAWSATRRGDQEAMHRYRELAERQDRIRPSHEMLVNELIADGMALIDRGLCDQGLRLLHKAIEPAEGEAARQVTPRALASVRRHLGVAHGRLGLSRTALRSLDQARELNELTRNAERLAQDWVGIGEVRARRPNLGDPVEAYEQALMLSSQPGRLGQPLTWLSASGAVWRVSAPERAWPAVIPLAKAREAAGSEPGAVAMLELGVELSELVRAGLRDRDAQVRVQEQRADAFAMLTRLHVQRADAGETGAAVAALTVIEQTRARSLLDVARGTELLAPENLPADLLAEERTLLNVQVELERQMPFDWERYRLLGRQLDAVWERIARYGIAAQDYVEVRRATPADPDDVRGVLGEGVVAATYAYLDDGSLVVITLRNHGAPRVRRLDVDASTVLRFVADNFGEAGRVRELATDLEGLFHHRLDPLVAPLAELSRPGETLVLCPSGVLTNVPLHALVIDGATLLDRNPVAYLPSMSMARTLRRRRLGVGAGAVVLGNPTGDLPYAHDEARTIGTRLGTSPLLGSGATVDAVLAAMPSASIFHAACHAHFDAADPLESGLMLAGGSLTARTILRQDWRALRLAVLSACETGVGRPSRVDETLGLTWAMLFVGAPALIMSLWRVPDASSATVMIDFYDGVLAGVPAAEALRAAMLASRARPGWERLDKWAAFCLLGQWDALPATGAGVGP